MITIIGGIIFILAGTYGLHGAAKGYGEDINRFWPFIKASDTKRAQNLYRYVVSILLILAGVLSILNHII